MNIIERIHESANQEPTELQKRLDKAFELYKKKFKNLDFTTALENDEEILIQKIEQCIELGIEFDELYLGNISDEDLI